MNDFKKTFLAGFFVLLILLLTPYYLQLIGYQETGAEGGDIEIEEKTLVAAGSQASIVPLVATPVETGSVPVEGGVLKIESVLYRASISTLGGGSFQKYILAQDGTNKYLGGYTEEGLYQDSINVSLILNQKIVGLFLPE